jgi:hypothetical protein
VEKYRWMVYVHGLRDIPVSFLESNSKYSIQYELAGQRIKIPLKFESYELLEKDLFRIAIEKIKVFYLFA